MKCYLIIYCACFLSLTGGFAQTDTFEIERELFPTTGWFSQDPASGLSLSYSVGEMVIETVESLGGTLILTQGFQQPDADTLVGLDRLEIELDYTIYPNPTSGPITIELHSPQPLIMYLAIYDLIGQATNVPMQEARFVGRFATQMDLSELSDGVYLLAILNEAKQIAYTFRIEKYF
ncbi:MAG: T9SS type A sorting domain-containing protein [Bacteroidota bacterium]